MLPLLSKRVRVQALRFLPPLPRDLQNVARRYRCSPCCQAFVAPGTRDRRTGAHPKLDLARAGRAAGADKELLTRRLLRHVRELQNAPAIEKKELQKGREERRAAQEMPASVSSIHTTRIVAG